MAMEPFTDSESSGDDDFELPVETEIEMELKEKWKRLLTTHEKKFIKHIVKECEEQGAESVDPRAHRSSTVDSWSPSSKPDRTISNPDLLKFMRQGSGGKPRPAARPRLHKGKYGLSAPEGPADGQLASPPDGSFSHLPRFLSNYTSSAAAPSMVGRGEIVRGVRVVIAGIEPREKKLKHLNYHYGTVIGQSYKTKSCHVDEWFVDVDDATVVQWKRANWSIRMKKVGESSTVILNERYLHPFEHDVFETPYAESLHTDIELSYSAVSKLLVPYDQKDWKVGTRCRIRDHSEHSAANLDSFKIKLYDVNGYPQDVDLESEGTILALEGWTGSYKKDQRKYYKIALDKPEKFDVPFRVKVGDFEQQWQIMKIMNFKEIPEIFKQVHNIYPALCHGATITHIKNKPVEFASEDLKRKFKDYLTSHGPDCSFQFKLQAAAGTKVVLHKLKAPYAEVNGLLATVMYAPPPSLWDAGSSETCFVPEASEWKVQLPGKEMREIQVHAKHIKIPRTHSVTLPTNYEASPFKSQEEMDTNTLVFEYPKILMKPREDPHAMYFNTSGQNILMVEEVFQPITKKMRKYWARYWLGEHDLVQTKVERLFQEKLDELLDNVPNKAASGGKSGDAVLPWNTKEGGPGFIVKVFQGGAEELELTRHFLHSLSQHYAKHREISSLVPYLTVHMVHTLKPNGESDETKQKMVAIMPTTCLAPKTLTFPFQVQDRMTENEANRLLGIIKSGLGGSPIADLKGRPWRGGRAWLDRKKDKVEGKSRKDDSDSDKDDDDDMKETFPRAPSESAEFWQPKYPRDSQSSGPSMQSVGVRTSSIESDQRTSAVSFDLSSRDLRSSSSNSSSASVSPPNKKKKTRRDRETTSSLNVDAQFARFAVHHRKKSSAKWTKAKSQNTDTSFIRMLNSDIMRWYRPDKFVGYDADQKVSRKAVENITKLNEDWRERNPVWESYHKSHPRCIWQNQIWNEAKPELNVDDMDTVRKYLKRENDRTVMASQSHRSSFESEAAAAKVKSQLDLVDQQLSKVQKPLSVNYHKWEKVKHLFEESPSGPIQKGHLVKITAFGANKSIPALIDVGVAFKSYNIPEGTKAKVKDVNPEQDILVIKIIDERYFDEDFFEQEVTVRYLAEPVEVVPLRNISLKRTATNMLSEWFTGMPKGWPEIAEWKKYYGMRLENVNGFRVQNLKEVEEAFQPCLRQSVRKSERVVNLSKADRLMGLDTSQVGEKAAADYGADADITAPVHLEFRSYNMPYIRMMCLNAQIACLTGQKEQGGMKAITENILEKLKFDLEWLGERGLTDYSLIIFFYVQEVEDEDGKKTGDFEVACKYGIIDYSMRWDHVVRPTLLKYIGQNVKNAIWDATTEVASQYKQGFQEGIEFYFVGSGLKEIL